MNRLLDVLARVWQAITRERAVITGLVLAGFVLVGSFRVTRLILASAVVALALGAGFAALGSLMSFLRLAVRAERT